MKKITVLITLVLVSLMIFNSCSKESTEKGKKIIMSSGQENFWCDDEYCYWIDPELLEPPILHAPVFGPKRFWGYEGTAHDPNGNEYKFISCPKEGRICGDIQEPDANGVLRTVGKYLQTN